jgi:hypothetical protein
MAADDLADAEAQVQRMQGIENHPYGVILIRAVRLLRAARTKFAATDNRLDALEARIATLEAKAP